MNMIQIGLLGITGVLLAVQFKGGKSEYGIYIAVGVSVLIFLTILGQFSVFVATLRQIAGRLDLESGQVSTLIKMIGITYVAEFASGICKDSGYQVIAVQIELFGKLSVFILSIPILTMVLETIGEFLS